MPINTVQQHILSILTDLSMFGEIPPLQAFIEPPNPNTKARRPMAYIWGSRGSETREAVPRARQGDLSSGGTKIISHDVDVWLIWFSRSGQPNADRQFPSIIDAVMAALRNTQLLDAASQSAVDPVTGQLSKLLAIGEDMTWDYAPVRAVDDQRTLRYDGQITCTVIEAIQA